MHSEVRDRLMYECDGISELVVWLDSINRRPGLDELESKLISTEVNIPVLRECIGYSENSYQRNNPYCKQCSWRYENDHYY